MDWQALRRLAKEGFAPRTLLDIGAHVGGFAKAFAEVFPGCVATLVEPNPFCAEALKNLGLEWHGVAASDENGEAELHLTKEWLQSTGASLYRENTHFFRDDVLIKQRVPKRRVDDVFAGRRFDFIKIDTQGAELDVLRGGRAVIAQADYILAEISLVDYNAGGARAEDVFDELAGMGFECAGVMEFHRLKNVASGGLLQMDFLFRRRGVTHTARPVSAIAAELENGAGNRSIEHELSDLLRMRDAGEDAEEFVPRFRRALTAAADRLNAALASGDWNGASRLAFPIAELAPGFAPAQRSAMTIAVRLGQEDKAGAYARSLLTLEPADRDAEKIAEYSVAVATAKPEQVAALRLALFAPPETHGLIRLRDIHDAASAILCGHVTGGDLIRVQMLLDLAKDLNVDVPPNSEFFGWVKHYRLALRAMEPVGVLASTQGQGIAVPSSFATAAQGAFTKEQFKQAIAARRPSVVFFAAADARYVDLYAKHFIESIQRNCDLPAAIVLHVIGGGAQLSNIARRVPDADGAVFLSGDDFDAPAIRTKCFDTPPKGLIPIPVAHYQSARFQRLGWLMETVERPVFVSDIDLLLQRGVADLLEKMSDCDVVFNENAASHNAGSRLTANLTLLNPTSSAKAFAADVKNYLDDALSGEEVSRWIDQFGLLIARHRLRRRIPAAKIGYFDTMSDINNVMYRSFEKNPFRFLSLYHGFDMSTLERAA